MATKEGITMISSRQIYIRSGSVDVAVETIGVGPQAVLLVHGLGANRGCWYRAREFFDPQRFRLVLPDFPGFGSSARPADFAYSMSDFGECLFRVISELQVERLHVVAHSMGCVAALAMLERHPIGLETFTATEGNLVAEDAFMSSKVARLTEATFLRSYTKWINMVQASLGEDESDQHARFIESLRGASPTAVHRASLSCNEQTRAGSLSRQFASLKCRLAYVYGANTPSQRPLPEVVTRPNVTRHAIANQGHFMMEAAESFYPWLVNWLSASG